MTTRRLLFVGAALLLLSLFLLLSGAGLRGPLNPACAGRPFAEGCQPLLPLLLFGIGLILGTLGAVLLAVWMGRRAGADEGSGE